MLTANKQRKPVLIVFAGPNGSGKTTVAHGLPVFGTYINADDLKKEYSLTDMEAAQQAEALRNELLNRGIDFSFETVLSTERNLLIMQKAKDCGYEVQCIYVLTSYKPRGRFLRFSNTSEARCLLRACGVCG